MGDNLHAMSICICSLPISLRKRSFAETQSRERFCNLLIIDGTTIVNY